MGDPPILSLPTNVDGVAGKRGNRRWADADAGGVAGDLQQGQPGGLIEYGVVHAHAAETEVFNGFGQRPVGCNGLVGLEGDAN